MNRAKIMSNLFSDDFNGCGELVLELFKGAYDFHEFVPDEEMTDLWKWLSDEQLIRFQVYQIRKTGVYMAYLCDLNPEYGAEETWSGLDLAEVVPIWIGFCERQKLKFSHSLQKTE